MDNSNTTDRCRSRATGFGGCNYEIKKFAIVAKWKKVDGGNGERVDDNDGATMWCDSVYAMGKQT